MVNALVSAGSNARHGLSQRTERALHVELASRVAPAAVDVLLEGETGAGKDVLAREIHQMSGRPGRFIAINCAAIPEALAESELFGYEVGAFTGAVRAREGKLEAADRGTLYLDEVDSMPLGAQAKLLRALQERGVERLGGSRFYRVELRVIASTKASLSELILQGLFRQDLYFRLNVVKIRVPPLRDDRHRIMPLFTQFVSEAAVRNGVAPIAVDADLRTALLCHDWPGNIRELRNGAERHALGLPPLDAGPASVPSPVMPAAQAPSDAGRGLTLRERMRSFERDVIVVTLKRHHGSVARASAELQVPPNTLYYRIKTLGIQSQPD